uniref:Translation initiation factor IF-2, chloroplastic n=1 Tax=Gronococcus sybilensis TaxID=3028029 RepID=A0A9Y1I2L3_9RHOD|nr:translation initiation factor 2 [Gronococcus sybilensis]
MRHNNLKSNKSSSPGSSKNRSQNPYQKSKESKTQSTPSKPKYDGEISQESNRNHDAKNTGYRKKQQNRSKKLITTIEKNGKSRNHHITRKAHGTFQANKNQINSIKISANNFICVSDLSERIKISETELIKYLFLQGYAITINQPLDMNTIKMIGEKFHIQVDIEEDSNVDNRDHQRLERQKSTESLDKHREPIVTIMGHVDHGKTTLLDTIRKSNSVKKEAGGITQKIIAHEVFYKEHKIIFLDTPGHEAFRKTRSRGALINDIALLVVAADEGIQPQTIEAINYFKRSEVPLIVVINKIDKIGANVEKTKQALTKYGIVPEELGGEEIVIAISALEESNIQALLESVLLVAELNHPKVYSQSLVKGTIIEAHLDKAEGPIAKVLLHSGNLYIGDTMVVNTVFGKVRSIRNFQNQKVSYSEPSSVIEVTGFDTLPQVGQLIEVYENEKTAKSKIKTYKENGDNDRQTTFSHYRGNIHNIAICNLIIKADTQNSIEAVTDIISQLPQTKIATNIIRAQTGNIGENDVQLALAANAYIINFNTSFTPRARKSASQKSITVIENLVIYELIQELEGLLKAQIKPEYEKERVGGCKVKMTFSMSKGLVAGCTIDEGKILSNSSIKVIRSGRTLYEGSITSLKRGKSNVEEVEQGSECGIFVRGFQDWRINDVVYVFESKIKPIIL